MPFSDPLADGPTIQRSTFDALRQGMTLAGTLELIERARLARPVVIFSYLNPILRYGVERFLARRRRASAWPACCSPTSRPGSDPGVESAIQREPARPHPPDRADDPPRAARGRRSPGAQGFVYLVARLGRHRREPPRWPRDLEASVARVRRATPLPVAVGFGISTPAQAARGRAAGRRRGGGQRAGRGAGHATGWTAARRFLEALRAALDARSGRRDEACACRRVIDRYARVLAVGGAALALAALADRPALDRGSRSPPSS